jgi:tRNA/tmRNA/rRNA uracil-C5-methylase (TrmA/RlmC/RlmD family)
LLPVEIARIAPVGVIVNPGRPGCRRAVLEALAPLRARRIAYLSCEPHTLARDLAILVRAGWSVRRIVPIDMMPHTDQVEALALLVG